MVGGEGQVRYSLVCDQGQVQGMSEMICLHDGSISGTSLMSKKFGSPLPYLTATFYTTSTISRQMTNMLIPHVPGDLGTCPQYSCSAPSIPHGVANPSYLSSPGDTFTVTCNQGYQLKNGPANFDCNTEPGMVSQQKFFGQFWNPEDSRIAEHIQYFPKDNILDISLQVIVRSNVQ